MGTTYTGPPLFQKAKDGALGDFYEYTSEGLLKCAISQGMRYAYEYDAMGRMIRKSASGRTLLALAYDKNGNKVSQTDVTGKITQYTYSPLDLLEKVWDDGRELAAYEYNADGTIHEERRGPLHKRYWYDLDKNLTGIRIHSGEELLVDNQYLYDGNGNRTHKKQLGGETLYHYDPLNQVKKVEYPGYTEELFYDKAGNRTRRIAHGVEELYQYDPRNRLTAYTKDGVTTPFRYDNAGNLLADDKARYTYDAFNRTIQVETFDGNVQVNRYDAEGLRHEMEENGNLVRFIFNQEREAVTEEDNTGLTRLIRATELIARSTDAVRTYYHYASDEMGSTTHIVDDGGAVQNRYEYDAWGNITAQEEAVPNRFKYTGQQLDPITQQYYLRARFYNPVIARFTQEDTYRGDGLNLYAYCANNPVFYVDPTGHYSDCVKEAYDRIRRENPTLSASVAYQRALQERGFDKLSKEDNRRRSEAANLNRQLKDPNLTPTERERIFRELDQINNEFSEPVQPLVPHAETPTVESRAGESGSKPKNVFPENPDDLLPEIPRNKVTKANGTTSQTIQTSDNIRIRAEQHPLLPGETYNPRHHGVHYHVEYKVNPIKGWNNKNNVKKCYPEGYIPGAGSGFIPGETFPE